MGRYGMLQCAANFSTGYGGRIVENVEYWMTKTIELIIVAFGVLLTWLDVILKLTLDAFYPMMIVRR